MTTQDHTLDGAITRLRSPRTIRARCAQIAGAVRRGDSRWFEIDDAGLEQAAALVAAVTRERYPDLRVPYHSRWRHFEVGGIDRLEPLLHGRSAAQQAAAMIDLAVVSVLLDAGAGPHWRYRDPAAPAAAALSRSEGLAIASLRAFASGVFSSDPGDPLRVDADALLRLDPQSLARALQVDERNPLAGFEGRWSLLRRLGDSLRSQPQRFGRAARPAGLLDSIGDGAVAAERILRALLEGFASIWPNASAIGGIPVGDVWTHRACGGDGADAGWVPFHKLSQWLCYSLIEPFERAGRTVAALDELTALAEYRNGGLLIDAGAIRLRDPGLAQRPLAVGDEAVVEWRALTVTLIDEIVPRVRAALRLEPRALPLAAVLEGGTWAAGRRLAAQRRDGAPPLTVISDGTVF